MNDFEAVTVINGCVICRKPLFMPDKQAEELLKTFVHLVDIFELEIGRRDYPLEREPGVG